MKWPNFILSALFSVLTITTFAFDKEEYSETENLTKTYAVSQDAYVEITNKYGSIEHMHWDKDSVKIEIEMIFNGPDYEGVQKMKDLFDIRFEGNSNFILAETTWSEDVNVFQKGMRELKQGIGSAQNLQINYKVYSPNTLEMELTNKFGDIFLSDYHGSLKVDLSYGDFRARNITNLKELKVGYGKVKVKNIPKGRLEFTSVKSADISETNDIIIKSTSSEIEIENSNLINLNSKHDEILFEEVSQVTGDLVLSDLQIDLIKSAMGTKSKFGSIRIKEIGNDAKDINLNGNRTDFRIGISSYFNANVDVTVSKDTDFIYDTQFKLERQLVNGDGLWNGSGVVGSESATKITIHAVNGYVEFDE